MPAETESDALPPLLRLGWSGGLGLLLYGAPPVLFLAAAASCWVDPHSAPLRATVLGLASLGGVLWPRLATLAVIASFCWFDIPILMAGFNNQFVSDVTIAGLLAGRMARRQLPSWRSVIGDTAHGCHPFALPAAGIAIAGVLGFAASLGELLAVAAHPQPLAVVAAILRDALLWHVAGVGHALSIALGTLAIGAFAVVLLADIRRGFLSGAYVMRSVLVGALPVFLLAYGQWFFPDQLGGASFMRHQELNGTLQNGNHLSFVAALLLFAAVAHAAVVRQRFDRMLAVSVAALAIVPLLFGYGRTAWGCVVLALFAFPVVLARYRWWWMPVAAGAMVGVALLPQWGYPVVAKTCDLVWSGSRVCAWGLDVMQKLQDGGFARPLGAAGRRELFAMAKAGVRDEPVLGNGLGSFWLHSGTDFEVHNQFLAVAVESGLLLAGGVGVACVLFALTWGLAWWRRLPSLLVWSGVAIGLTLAVGLTLDQFLSYRPIAALVATLVVWMVVQTSGPPAWSQRWLLPLVMVLPVVGLVVGIAAAGDPRPIVRPDLLYDREQDGEGRQFRWSGPVMRVTVPPHSCVESPVRVDDVEAADLSVGWARHDRRGSIYLHIDEALALGGQLRRHLRAPAGTWTPVCGCNRTDEAAQLVVMRDRGFVPSFRDLSVVDDRYLGFRVRATTVTEASAAKLAAEEVRRHVRECAVTALR